MQFWSTNVAHTLLIVAAALVLAPAPAAAQSLPSAPTFTLDVAAPAAQDLAFTVQAPATVPVKIIRSAGGGKAMTLDVTPFTSDQGFSAPVTISAGGSETAASHLENVSFNGPLLTVELHIPALPAAGKYSGRMLMTTPDVSSGQGQVTVWRFTFSSADARPATLVIDQTNVSLTAVRRWCAFIQNWNLCVPGGDAPVVTVHVRDKSGNWPLNGVMARLEPGLKSNGLGFDPKERIKTSFDGREIADLFSSPGPGDRQVAAQGQGTVTMAFQEMPAGEYTVPLRLTAMNSGDDDAQRLNVTLDVRNHVIGAIIVLVLAALLSFLATKIVTGFRQRAGFLERARNLRPDWLAEEAATLSVVSLRAAYHQTMHLSKAYLLIGQAGIEARLAAAERMLAVLDQSRQIRDKMHMAIRNPAEQNRALLSLDRCLRQVGGGPLTEQDAARIKALLDDLASWYDPEQQEKRYWAELLPIIAARCDEVQPNDLPEDSRASAKTLLAKLRAAIKDTALDLNGKNAAEASYARLTILWQLRSHDDAVSKLLKLSDWPEAPLDKVYGTVDDFGWSRLTNDKTRTIKPPPADIDPPETDTILTFRVTTNDPELNDSFLMHRKLTYQWRFAIARSHPRWAFWRDSEEVPIPEIVSNGPAIALYSPYPGQISGSVCITYKDPQNQIAVSDFKPLKIASSNDFRVLANLGTADGLAFLVALLFSVITGVGVYALTPTFGSIKDYLTLFTWGAGVDQGKNFLQSLAAYSTVPSKPAT